MEAKQGTKKSYSFSFKLKVIKYAEENGKHKASKLFGVDRKRVREWCQNKIKIQEGLRSQQRLPGGGRGVRYKDIDEELKTWLDERRAHGICRSASFLDGGM